MLKVESFRAYAYQEEKLSKEIELFLKNKKISRQDIIDINFTASNDYLYCMVVWEEQLCVSGINR